ncbi:MAG TPA: amino acid adenylation domain-containing protein, partial [Verrucomicrobiae bacterium]|nr:amino acid adenylation domain-containing protein [Verrucomicrobiae bacterium]
MQTNLAAEQKIKSVSPRRAAEFLRDATGIHHVVEAQVKQRPDAVAVACNGEKLSYRELNECANQVAHALQKAGVGPESLVGLLMNRSVRTVVGILGILKAGGCYVPIDLAYPKERIQFILKDSNAAALISESEHGELASGFSGKTLCLDPDLKSISQESRDALSVPKARANAAYVIYTSGSTGQPKGVIVTHHNVLRLFEATDHWFHFNHEDVWTLFHSFAFDFSVWELWGALFYGGTAVVVRYCDSRDPAAFYELLARDGVTVLSQTPSAFRQLMWAEENAPEKRRLRLRYVVFGGEALELQSLRPWYERHAADAPLLVNMYGITETTVHVTYRPIYPLDIAANLGSVIGEPIPDLTIHLLDENGKEVPAGTPGEIYVGGEGVARGYLNRPELNHLKFIPDHFNGKSGARLYRSGDLAKRLSNGDLEYLGRIDHQVKIHGFRIELGEIETVLNSHPAIRESVVICDESAGDKRLVAYIVARAELPSLNALREFASRRLPAYMVPARIIALDKMPLTVNGKVDRKVLPAPDSARPSLGEQFVAPSTPDEKALAEIWQEVLGIDQVGVNDNFFELGGDSIRSIQVLAKAQERGINFSLQKLFQQPTIAALARNLDAESDDKIERNSPPFALISEKDRAKIPGGVIDAYPIGRLQHGMIFHSDLDKESAIFHDVFSFRLKLPYNRETFRQAIERLTDRHSIFRTSFHLEGFAEPLQLVHQKVKTPFSEEDLRDRPADEQRQILIDWVECEKRNRFQWDAAPLMRLHVQRFSDDVFQFIVSFHHAIMDGWSLAMMLTELFQDYAAILAKSESPVHAPRVTYRDFVALEQQTVSSKESQDFWRGKIENAVTHTLPRWPLKTGKKAHEQTRGPEIYYPATLLKALQDLARSCGVPIRTVLLAAHCRVMKLLTGYDDIMTGLVANGRPQCLDGERLIGLFLNTLPFRVQVGTDTWRELVKKTFAVEQELIPHRRMPLSDIQQMAGGKTLFETTFDFVQFHVYRDLPGYSENSFLEDHYFEANNFNFFVTFMLDASASELQMHFDYNPNDFPPDQIKAICDYYTETLRAMAAAPEDPITNADLLPSTERRKLLTEWNATEAPIPDKFVHEIFQECAACTPDNVAAIFGREWLSYSDLNARADLLANELQTQGVGPGVLVGVYLDRSLEMLVSILGVMKAGGAY